jgi:hypothetical protein
MARWRVLTVDDSAAILTMIAAYLEGSDASVNHSPEMSSWNSCATFGGQREVADDDCGNSEGHR